MRTTAITRNMPLKLFSFAVALVVFLIVSAKSSTPVDVEMRIDYRTDDGMMVTGDPPATLHATLQGPWANFGLVGMTDLQPVIVDLRGVEPGSVLRSITLDDIHPPGGMQVLAVRPAEVEVVLDRRVERQVAVECDFIERPAFGYEILAVHVDPPQVRVTGPLSKMRTLDFVTTRPIDINGKEKDVSLTVDLRPPTSGLRLLQKQVQVLIEIREETVQRTFPNVRVTAENAPRGTRVSPDTVTISIKGPRQFVDNVDGAKLTVFVDVQPEAEEGRRSFEKAVELKAAPERTVLVDPIPQVVIQVPKTSRRRRK